MFTKNLDALRIHKLSREQYERELEAGNIEEDAMYCTPEQDYTPEDSGAVSEKTFKEHKEAENPHNITAALIGALSCNLSIPDNGNADEAVVGGVYSVGDNVANFPYSEGGLMLTLVGGATIVQLAFSSGAVMPQVRVGDYDKADDYVYYNNGWQSLGYIN